MNMKYTPKTPQDKAIWSTDLPPSDRLRFMRENLGLTQKDLARELGISLAQVNRHENGLKISSTLAIKIARWSETPLSFWYNN